MYYQKEENNTEDEEISQNESSEELKELTENNNRSKNEVMPNNHINDEYSQKKKLIYNKDDVTEEMINSNNIEEKRENSNLKYENEKPINIKKENEDYIFDNYKRKSENSILPQTFYTSKFKQLYDENTDKNYNYSSRIINNDKDNEQKKGENEFKGSINNNKNNLDSNREGKNTHHLNFSYKDGENIDSGIPVDVDLMVKRSDGKNKYITLKDVPIGSESQKMELRTPDYSEFYNIERLSEEINKFYKTKE